MAACTQSGNFRSVRVSAVTSGEDLEQVPLKVVPMYVEGPAPAPETPDDDSPELEVAPERRWRPIVGAAALLLAVATAVMHGIAVNVASNGDAPAGTTLAYVAIALSALAVLAGLVALIANLGRRVGAAAIVLGVLANPVVLLWVLRWFGGAAA